jgi:beta-xylosidase
VTSQANRWQAGRAADLPNIGWRQGHQLRHLRGPDQQDRASRSASPSRKLHLRLVNDRNVITLYTSADGQQWSRYRSTLEVSGYHHNVAGGFISFRPAIYAAGQGQVKFRNFGYLALPWRPR